MKTKQTLVLVIVVLVVLVAYLLFFRQEPTTTRENGRIFPEISPDAVSELTISLPERTIALKKTGEDWYLVKPLEAKATNMTVRAILEDLRGLKPIRRITAKDDPDFSLQRYGLEDPAGTITFRHKDKVYALEIAGPSPSGDYYAAVPGKQDRVYVLPGTFYKGIDFDASGLRDHRPFVFSEVAVNRVSLRSAKELEEFVFSRKGIARPWRVIAPVQGRADQRKLNTVLRALLEVTVDEFASDSPEDDPKFGLTKPAVTASVWEGDTKKTLIIGTPLEGQQDLYAKVQGSHSIFKPVDQQILTTLDKSLDYFRDRDLFSFRSQDVVKINIEMPGKPPTVLQEKGGVWHVDQPRQSLAYGANIEKLLGLATTARIYMWEAEKPEHLGRYGLERPAMTTTFTLADGTARALLLGNRVAPASKTFYARRKDEGAIIIVHNPGDATTIYDAAKTGYLAFLTRRLLNLDTADAVKLTITDIEKPTVTCERIGKDQWQVVQPLTVRGDLANINDVLVRIATLQCFGYTTDDVSDLRKHMLAQPRRTVSVVFKTQAPEGDVTTQTYTLLLGGFAGQYYQQAMFAGGDLIFQVNRDIYKESGEEMVSLQAFGVKPKSVRQVAFIYPDQTIQCRRVDDAWQITQPKQLPADPDLINALLDVVESIRAAGYADYEPKDLSAFGLDKPSFRLQLVLDEGATRQLLIGKPASDDLVYAKDADADPVFQLPVALVDKLRKKVPDLRLAPLRTRGN